MKKSVFTLIALATVSVSVFTSCDKNDDGYAKDKSYFSQSTNSSLSQDGEFVSPQVKISASETSLELKKNAPSNAGEQVAAAVKSYLDSKINADWEKTDVVYENGKISVTLNTPENRKESTMALLAMANSEDFSMAMYNLGFVKSFTMSFTGVVFNYAAKAQYKGSWECTDSKGNKYVLKIAESTESPKFFSTENVQLTVNGKALTANLSGTTITVVDGGKSRNAAEQFFNAVINACTLKIKSVSDDTMHVKIQKYDEVIDNDAVFTKVQD